MRRFDESKYWLKSNEVKVGMSQKKVVEKMIIGIGEKLLNEMMLEKYRKLVMNNN